MSMKTDQKRPKNEGIGRQPKPKKISFKQVANGQLPKTPQKSQSEDYRQQIATKLSETKRQNEELRQKIRQNEETINNLKWKMEKVKITEKTKYGELQQKYDELIKENENLKAELELNQVPKNVVTNIINKFQSGEDEVDAGNQTHKVLENKIDGIAKTVDQKFDIVFSMMKEFKAIICGEPSNNGKPKLDCRSSESRLPPIKMPGKTFSEGLRRPFLEEGLGVPKQ